MNYRIVPCAEHEGRIVVTDHCICGNGVHVWTVAAWNAAHVNAAMLCRCGDKALLCEPEQS